MYTIIRYFILWFFIYASLISSYPSIRALMIIVALVWWEYIKEEVEKK